MAMIWTLGLWSADMISLLITFQPPTLSPTLSPSQQLHHRHLSLTSGLAKSHLISSESRVPSRQRSTRQL